MNLQEKKKRDKEILDGYFLKNVDRKRLATKNQITLTRVNAIIVQGLRDIIYREVNKFERKLGQTNELKELKSFDVFGFHISIREITQREELLSQFLTEYYKVRALYDAAPELAWHQAEKGTVTKLNKYVFERGLDTPKLFLKHVLDGNAISDDLIMNAFLLMGYKEVNDSYYSNWGISENSGFAEALSENSKERATTATQRNVFTLITYCFNEKLPFVFDTLSTIANDKNFTTYRADIQERYPLTRYDEDAHKKRSSSIKRGANILLKLFDMKEPKTKLKTQIKNAITLLEENGYKVQQP